MTQWRNPATGERGGAVVIQIQASGNAESTSLPPDNATAARIIARRHCLSLPIALLLVGLGASGVRMAT
jgi:hypothetical protein